MILESPVEQSLVLYEKLYDFIQVLRYGSEQDHKVIEKLLDLNKSDPDRVLSLISALLISTVSQEQSDKLRFELEQASNEGNSKATSNYYSFT